MSETIKDEDRFLEATETGVMDLNEPIVEASGPATGVRGFLARAARNPAAVFLIAAAVGFLLWKAGPAVRHGRADVQGAPR